MSERRTHLDGLAIVLMLTCCVLWGVQQVVVKLTLPVFLRSCKAPSGR